LSTSVETRTARKTLISLAIEGGLITAVTVVLGTPLLDHSVF
jgi:hypothetical protein